MGRGRGKGKKQTVAAAHDDLGNGEEEKFQATKRRGRPHKSLKDEVEEEEEISKIEDDNEKGKSLITSKSSKDQVDEENGAKRRKRSSLVKENSHPIKEENGFGPKSSSEGSIKPVGFRQNGSRRKSKPRRAAEVGVECS